MFKKIFVIEFKRVRPNKINTALIKLHNIYLLLLAVFYSFSIKPYFSNASVQMNSLLIFIAFFTNLVIVI